MTEKELIEKLLSYGIELDRATMQLLCERYLSAQAITESLTDAAAVEGEPDDLKRDWIWVCLADLWRRWFPEKPCFELLDGKIQDGYDLLEERDTRGACKIWLEAWSDVLRILDKTGMKSIKEFDRRFAGSQLLFNWLQDLEMELGNAAIDDPKFYPSRISFCEEQLKRFAPEGSNENNTRMVMCAMAESYFHHGDIKKAEELFTEWLRVDPQWSMGRLCWSDCYHIGRRPSRNLARSEQILKEGLAIEGVTDRVAFLERLLGIFEEQGREPEAKEVMLSLKTSMMSQDSSLRASSLDNFFAESTWSAAPVAASKATRPTALLVGKKDPCPCGSGRKFKRCCG